MTWEINKLEIEKGAELVIINICSIDNNLKKMIDDNIISICRGNADFKLKFVKDELLRYLANKGKKKKMGAIAEFFVHLYLNSIDIKQECLFSNLEEQSAKKGFDGVYSKGKIDWYMESKSGSINTVGISHKVKVKESYNDLCKKFEGKVSNNPWLNAYNHSDLKAVNTKQSLKKRLMQFSEEFSNGNVIDIGELNIIPCATIFLDNKINLYKTKAIQSDILAEVKGYNYKKLKIICVTQKSIDLFCDYLTK